MTVKILHDLVLRLHCCFRFALSTVNLSAHSMHYQSPILRFCCFKQKYAPYFGSRKLLTSVFAILLPGYNWVLVFSTCTMVFGKSAFLLCSTCRMVFEKSCMLNFRGGRSATSTIAIVLLRFNFWFWGIFALILRHFGGKLLCGPMFLKFVAN